MKLKPSYTIAIIYTSISLIYILTSDYFVEVLFPAQVTYIQTYKGIAFVLASGLVIYVLVDRLYKKLTSVNDDLKRNSEFHQMLFDQSPIPSFVIDIESLRYLKVNKATLIRSGRTKDEFLGSKAYEFLTDSDRDHILRLKELIQDNGYLETNLDTITKDGRVINQHVFCQQIEYYGKPAVLVISIDITAMKEPERVLMDQMLTMLENERKRIARDIHDGIKQYFGMSHGIMKTLEAKDPSNTMIKRVSEILDQGVEESRRLSHSITPQTSDRDFDLMDSLTYLIENLNHLKQVKFSVLGNLSYEYSQDVMINIYRIIQEATNNIISHAKANQATIRIDDESEDLLLEINDDGVGFDSSLSSKSIKSIGLVSMRTRVSGFDGWLTISSKPGSGTQILVKIPGKNRK